MPVLGRWESPEQNCVASIFISSHDLISVVVASKNRPFRKAAGQHEKEIGPELNRGCLRERSSQGKSASPRKLLALSIFRLAGEQRTAPPIYVHPMASDQQQRLICVADSGGQMASPREVCCIVSPEELHTV